MEVHELNMLFVFSGTQYKPDRFILSFKHFIFLKPAQIQLHLTLICRLEISQFQIDSYHAAQTTVKKKKIDIIVLIINSYTLLSGHECKIVAHFSYEILKFTDNC